MANFIKYFFLINVLNGINIGHNIINSSQVGVPIEFELSLDIPDNEVLYVNLMYNANTGTSFTSKIMNKNIDGYYICVLPNNFIKSKSIKYYFMIQLENQGIVTLPDYRPDSNPFNIDLYFPEEEKSSIDSNRLFNIEDKVLILSPKSEENIVDKSIMLAVSYFSFEHIDTKKTKVYLDEIDISNLVTMSNTYFSGEISDLYEGKHQLKIVFKSKYGLEYEPLVWEFFVKHPTQKKWMSEYFSQSGKIQTIQYNSDIDGNVLNKNDLRIDYEIDFDWLYFDSDFFITSLENQYEESRNRYGVNLLAQNINFKIGDFYPTFDNFALNGVRVRGYFLDLDFDLFDFKYISGSTKSAINGDPATSMYISDIVEPKQDLPGEIIVNRRNYSFLRDINALQFNIGNKDKFNSSFYFVKSKDNLFSVNNIVRNATIVTPKSIITSEAINFLNQIDTDNYSADFQMLYDNQSLLLDNYSISVLDQNWGGESPQDNIVLGFGFDSFLDDKKVKLKYRWSFSMLNTNIWESINSSMELDTIGVDTLIDGRFMDVLAIPENLDLSSFNEFFQLGINQTPIFPFDISEGEIGISEVLNMPSVSSSFSSSFNYSSHLVSYEYTKVGPHYNSLSNQNLETNYSKNSLSDRFRLLDNKLFVYYELYSKKNGLELDAKNIIKTIGNKFSFSYYPGPKLPSLSFGLSTSNRYNEIDFLYISENSDTTDSRLDVKYNNYNISINDEYDIFGKQTVIFNLFVSEIKDILENDKIRYNQFYFSPRSFLKNSSFAIFTTFNNYWESNISYSKNYYNAGRKYNETSIFIEQYITNLNLSIIYYSENFMIQRFKTGLSFNYGSGDQEFSYLGLKISLYQLILNMVKVDWDIQFQRKWVNDEVMNNSIFTIKLLYTL